MTQESTSISQPTITLESFVKSVIDLYTDCEISFGFEHEFDSIKFKQDIDVLTAKISSESAKFSIAFKPPVLKENEAACKSFLEPLAQLSLITKSIPSTEGKTFIKAIKGLTQGVLKNCIALANSFLETPVKFDFGEKHDIRSLSSAESESEYLKQAGLVWSACDAFKAGPSNNKDATQSIWKNLIALVDDVAKEIQELKDGSENEEENQDDLDQVIKKLDDFDFELDEEPLNQKQLAQVKASHSMVKLTQLLMNKVSKRSVSDCSLSIEGVALWLDELVGFGRSIQDFIDELGMALWERESDDIVSFSAKLVDDAKQLIILAQKHTDESHKKWFEGCEKQLYKLAKDIEDNSS